MSDVLASSFRINVRLRMQSLGITQGELAERMEVSDSYVSQMLSGHRDPGLNSLEKVAKALKIEAADLLREKSRKKFGKSA